MTGLVRQGYEGVLQALAARMHIIPHRRIAAVKTTRLAQPIKHPLHRMTRLLRRPYSVMQNLLDKLDRRIELRTMWRHTSAMT